MSSPLSRLTGRTLWCYSLVALVTIILLLSLHSTPESITTTFRKGSGSLLASTPNLEPGSTFLYDPSNTLAYRTQLELSTSPPEFLAHSPTLTFDHIYVLSLPWRTDRREQMTKLARALGVEITFVDASSKEEPFIRWIAEQAVIVRKQRLEIMAKTRKVPIDTLGGLTVGNTWLQQSADEHGRVPFPKLKTPSFPGAENWVEYLEQHDVAGTLDQLVPNNPKLNVTEALIDPVEKIAGRQVNEGVISTFWGHTRAMQQIVRNNDKSALILEDDVDAEWDLERMWSRIERRLPTDWDAALLGHCWGRELLKPAYLHPLLHQSSVPLCLHAYALSNKGARTLLSLLNNPWTAYQTAVDTAVPSFVMFGLLNSFSVEPPLIIQRKDGPSDIQAGIGSKWRGLLADSTVERIAKSEGEPVYEDVWDPENPDPATIFRYGKHCHA